MRQRFPSFRGGSSLLWMILRIVRIGRFSNLAGCSGVRNGGGSACFSIDSSPLKREFQRLSDGVGKAPLGRTFSKSEYGNCCSGTAKAERVSGDCQDDDQEIASDACPDNTDTKLWSTF